MAASIPPTVKSDTSSSKACSGREPGTRLGDLSGWEKPEEGAPCKNCAIPPRFLPVYRCGGGVGDGAGAGVGSGKLLWGGLRE
jgi:hypothetical protein